MKKYFTKYLPIEGEIKEGDWYKSKFRSENKFFHYEQWKDDRTTYFGNNPKEDVLFKVKLFLCSRDIQVGDEYYNSMGYKVDHTWDEEAIQDSKDFPDDIFKVIGEISPDAIWVKEGDEFDEDELEPVAYCIKHPDESIYFDDMSQILEWIKYKFNPKTHKALIGIKCPTCKQFH